MTRSLWGCWWCWAAAALALLLLPGLSDAYTTSSSSSFSRTATIGFRKGGFLTEKKRPTTTTTTRLFAAPRLEEEQRDSADNALEGQRSQLTTTLESIDSSLRRAAAVVEREGGGSGDESDDEDLLPVVLRADEAEAEMEIRRLERSVELLPPVGLSLDEYRRAVRLFLGLPFEVRSALCMTLVGLEGLEAGTGAADVEASAAAYRRVPEIVSRLYEERCQLTPQRLRDAYRKKDAVSRRGSSRDDASTRTSSSSSNEKTRRKSNRNSIMSSIFTDGDGGEEAESRQDIMSQELLGRVTRLGEDRAATEADLKTLLEILNKDKDAFVARSEEAVPGGYFIRGANRKASGKELIDALDEKLPSEWSAQVCYLPDVTATNTGLEGGDNAYEEDGEPVLVLLNKDVSPTANGWLLTSLTAASVISVFLFAIGVYGSTGAVPDYLEELVAGAAAVGDDGSSDGFLWFAGKVLDVIAPLAVVQGVHELGHAAVARRDGLKLALPTLLPFWGLPFLGAQTQLKESPKSLSSLFDFAICGPLLGICASLAFLVYGLQATTTVDPELVKFLPALPARILQSSTLGGTLVDNFLGGNIMAALSPPALQAGDAITAAAAQGTAEAIPLHPFAVAGFVSLIIQCLDLLPLGSTDGGRLSLAVFGRQGHSIVGGLTWAALLLASLFGDNSDILLYAWAVNSVVQSDPEVPCRNEVDPVSLPRSLAAISLWFFALLVVVPIQISSS